MAASSSLAGKTVVVTGASSGIGRAAAIAFAREGAHVVLAARGRDGLAAAERECARAGASTLVVPTDVGDPAAVAALVDAAIARFGTLDVMVSNAGVGVVGAFDTVPIAAHRRVIETNLVGQMNAAHAALPHFRRRGRGVLIHIASIGGWVASPYASAYCASKFGLRGFTEALRAELAGAPGIHVCTISPTFVDTPGMAHGANYTGKRLKPPPPMLDPREVAAAIVRAAKSPQQHANVTLGSVAVPARIAHALAPGLVGRATKFILDVALARADPVPRTDGNLFEASRPPAIDGGYRRGGTGLFIAAGIGALALAVASQGRSRRSG